MDAPLDMRPQATGDGSLSLYSERYGQLFHSLHGALREARHVFLEASGVAQRLANGQGTRVLEVGFGTGLNALVTADAAAASGAVLEFVSLERELLGAEVLRTLDYGRWLARPALATRLHDGIGRGTSELELDEGIVVRLVLGEALAAELPTRHFHAVYLDAFSPDANPELWTLAFLRSLHASLVEGGRLTTYTAKGTVRRALTEAGFRVERLGGPPGKRHMTRATACHGPGTAD